LLLSHRPIVSSTQHKVDRIITDLPSAAIGD